MIKGVAMNEEHATACKKPVNKTEIKLVPLKGLKAMVQPTSPETASISAEDLQADRDDNTNMVPC